MTYPEAIDWLYDLRLLGSKLGLDNPRQLASLADDPQEQLQIIHVAGTNGKGSVCAHTLPLPLVPATWMI